MGDYWENCLQEWIESKWHVVEKVICYDKYGKRCPQYFLIPGSNKYHSKPDFKVRLNWKNGITEIYVEAKSHTHVWEDWTYIFGKERNLQCVTMDTQREKLEKM